MNRYAPGDALTRHEKAREVRRNRIHDLESIITDLSAAHSTSEELDDLSHLTDKLDALAGEYRTALIAAELGND
jgi:hypothetical protein